MRDLKVGDLVKLKSGSDILTVDEVHQFKKQFEKFKLNKESVIRVEIIEEDEE